MFRTAEARALAKKLAAEQLSAEQAMGRLYNTRNACMQYFGDIQKKGIRIKEVFHDENGRKIPPDQWRVQVEDELLTMDETRAMLMIMGYIE